MTPPLVFDRPRPGHHRRGVDVLAKVLDGVILMAPIPAAWWRLLRWPGPVVFQTADGYLLSFFWLCLTRSVLGRRSMGTLLRNPREAGWKSRLRGGLVACIRALPRVTVLIIIAPDGAGSAPGNWIYDIEWWDLEVLPLADCNIVLPEAPVVLGIGMVGRHKGLDFFLAAAQAARGRNIRFVLVGDARRLEDGDRERFHAAGGLLIPPPARDAEFVSYIRHADWIWCCYHPRNDKSSGIFGRALQLGKRSIVRRGSYLQPFQERFGSGIAVDFGDVGALLEALESASDRPTAPETMRFAPYSIDRLRQACGLDTSQAGRDA